MAYGHGVCSIFISNWIVDKAKKISSYYIKKIKGKYYPGFDIIPDVIKIAI